MQGSAEGVRQGEFDDGGHNGGVRICVSSRVTVGSRHDLSKIARIFYVRCREVLKTCSRGVFDDGGHDGGVRICVSLRVTVGSRHDLSKIARIFCVRCRKVLKTCSRGFSMMADTMAASEFAYRRGLR